MGQKRGKGKPFPKGVSGNPEGARKHNQEVKVLRRLSHEQLVHVATVLLKTDQAKLQELADDPSTPALKAWISRIIITGIDGGNDSKLETILNRLHGRVPDKVDLTVKRPYGDMSAEQIQAEIKELEELERIKAAQAKKIGNTSGEP